MWKSTDYLNDHDAASAAKGLQMKGSAVLRMNEESFVKAWAQASRNGLTLSQLAKKLNAPYMEVWNMGRKLSSIGVELPNLWGMRKVNQERIDRLNRIVKSEIYSK